MKVTLHSKIEYLELLLENPDGLTGKEIEELYFDDVSADTAAIALKRLFKQGCAKRERDGQDYRYWITEAGIMKYYYLTEET